MKYFWRILAYAKPYRSKAVTNIIFNFLTVVFSLVSITLVVPVLDLIFNTETEVVAPPVYDSGFIDYAKDYFNYEVYIRVVEMGQETALLYVCLLVIIAFFLKNLTRYLAMYSITPLRNGVTRDLRSALHRKILELPISYFGEKRKGDIISRMTTDLKEIEWSLLMTLELVFREPIMILGSLGILLYMSPKLTLFVLVLLPLVTIVITSIGKSLKKSSSKAQSKLGELMSMTEESVSGLKVIKAFNAENLKRSTFQKSIDQYFGLMNSVMRKNDLASPLSEFLGATVMAMVIWFGGSLALTGEGLSAGEFIAYVLFFYQIIPPAKALSKASYHIQRGNAGAERVLEILDAENSIKDARNAKLISDFKDSVEFKNASFSYGEKRVLKNIDLKVTKGKMLALVGQSGGGKTSLVNLVPRFYDLSEGSLEIDGKNVKGYKLKDLRSLMGIVTQESLLFNGSVFYNIALAKPQATIEEVERAAKIANAHEFVEKLPEGYATNIGDGGMKLSGGQRQRLSIARAVLKNPPILILDEATSALDTNSEKLVQDALFKLMQNRTSLVIAHRLSTIQHADEIIVMDQGRIAERGNHQELIDKGGIYTKLVEMQKFD